MYVFRKCHICNTFICIYHNCRCRGVQPAVRSESLAPTRLSSLQIPIVNSGVPTTTIKLNNLLEWLTELSEVLYLVSWFYHSESLQCKPAKERDAQGRVQEGLVLPPPSYHVWLCAQSSASRGCSLEPLVSRVFLRAWSHVVHTADLHSPGFSGGSG